MALLLPESLSTSLQISSSYLKMKGFLPELFKTKVDSQFYCGLCKLVLRWPMQTSCGCRFCIGCIHSFIGQDQPKEPLQCPICEDEFEAVDIIRDNYSRKQLEKTVVYCPNKPNGCPDEMKLKDLDVHLEGCTFEKIGCMHKTQGCTARLLRGKLADHLQNECLFRLATCEYCGVEFANPDLEIHQQKCKASLEECPNKCTPMGIHHDRMNRHVQVECPLALLDCFFLGYGCKYQSTRKEMKKHTMDAQADHLQLMVKWLEETRLKLTETQHLVQEISNNKDIMESQMETLTAHVSTMQFSTKKTETLVRELQKLVAKHSDHMDTLEMQGRQTAKKEDVAEMKKTMVKPLQDKQDQMEDRLKHLEEGGVVAGGGSREGGGSAANSRGVSNARMTSVENQMGLHAVRLAEHELRFQVQETANYEGVLLWKIKDFARRKRDADSGKTLSLYSQPFYTSRYGYKMCARIYLNGDGLGKGTHLSLFFVVMRGNYDALLSWPYCQKVTLLLLDQETGKRHLSDSFRPDPKSSSFQRPTTEMNIASGCPLFVNQTVLRNSTYVKDDVMFIKVIVDTLDLYGP